VWQKKMLACSITCTWLPIQHGSMQGMWRKTLTPHPNNNRKTAQTKKANQKTNYHVAALKNFLPHKEKKA
jgi:hypothetical protein